MPCSSSVLHTAGRCNSTSDEPQLQVFRSSKHITQASPTTSPLTARNLTIAVAVAMPFNNDGFYAHDFRRLPIIWEQDEDSDYDDDSSSSVDLTSPISSDFNSGSFTTITSEPRMYPATISKRPVVRVSKRASLIPHTATVRVYGMRSSLTHVALQARSVEVEIEPPRMRQSMVGGDGGRSRMSQRRQKWSVFRIWSKSKTVADDDETSSDSDGG